MTCKRGKAPANGEEGVPEPSAKRTRRGAGATAKPTNPSEEDASRPRRNMRSSLVGESVEDRDDEEVGCVDDVDQEAEEQSVALSSPPPSTPAVNLGKSM